jgi:acyl transferase domain-containing protein
MEAGDAALNATDVAATLQIGREAETRRLAVVASGLPAVCEHLRHWLDNGAAAGQVLQTDAPDSMRELGQRWVSGSRVDWQAELGSTPWRRAHLPPPPLRRDQHWHNAIHPKPPRAVQAAEHAVGPILEPGQPDQSHGALRWTVFCDWPTQHFEAFRRHSTESDGVRALDCDAAGMTDRFSAYSKALSCLVQDILAELGEERAMLQLVLQSGLDQTSVLDFISLLRAAAQVHPRFSGQVVLLDRDTDAVKVFAALRRVAVDELTDDVHLSIQTRWPQNSDLVRPEERTVESAALAVPDKDPAILIVGASSGIGLHG